MIYRHFIRFPKGVLKAKHMSSRLQLFLVNRQLFTEASALFYADNVFKFYSAYVSRGQDPFGFNLTRIRKCFLHLNGTHPNAYDFFSWYIKEFADALVKSNSLEYLLLRILPHQLQQLSPLEKINNIKFVQIDLVAWSDAPYYAWPFRRQYLSLWGKYDTLMRGPQQKRHVQLLERLMMSDGKAATEVEIRDRIAKAMEKKNSYTIEPPLSISLTGDALQEAKVHGGWADGNALYTYLGVDPFKWLGRTRR